MKLISYSEKGAVGAVFIITFLVVVGAAFWYMYTNSKQEITTFEQCVAAGNPVQESYPEVCATEDGQSFPNPTQILE